MEQIRKHNSLTLTLRVMNDTDKRKAVYRVSKDTVCVHTYLNTGKNQEGRCNPPLNFNLYIHDNNDFCVQNIIQGNYITVNGELGAESAMYDKEFCTDMIIKVNKIIALGTDIEGNSNDSDIWN